MTDTPRNKVWLVRGAAIAAGLLATSLVVAFLLSRADGPTFIFAGGPLRSGELVALHDLDWEALDRASELEMEIVGEETDRKSVV